MSTNTEFEAFQALDLTPIKLKLMHVESGEGWSEVRANAVETEYRRFLFLMKKYPDCEASPTVDVDTFWHYHILDTMKYARDCEEVFGHFLHHYPYVGIGEGAVEGEQVAAGERMRALYAAEFGAQAAGKEAWCASPGKAADRAWCASPGKAADSAWCASPGKGADSAWCASPGKGADAAWCASPGRGAGSAWCASPGKAASKGSDAAWCASPGKGAATAWCASPGNKIAQAVKTAWCASPGKDVSASDATAWCASPGKSASKAGAGAWCASPGKQLLAA
jgi:hypothetical protein